jgi:hypothetical protein
MSALFDDVSRIIASSMPRRQAFRLIGTAMGGALAASLGMGRASRGWAAGGLQDAPSTCGVGKFACGSKCCTVAVQRCCGTGSTAVCCSAVDTCCSGGSGTQNVCCGAGQSCCKGASGTKCCSAGQTCCNGVCCGGGTPVCCGEPSHAICCNSGEVCCSGKCCEKGPSKSNPCYKATCG